MNATNWRCHRAAVARGVKYAFEMAAKFPSIALVKYRRGMEGMKTGGDGERGDGGTVQGRGRRPVADAGEGCVAITQIAALFSPASGSPPAEEHHDGRVGPRSFSPGGGGRHPGGEIPGTFMCVHGMFRGRARLPPFHSAAVSMDSIGRAVSSDAASGGPLSPRLMTERGRSPE